MAAMVTLVQIQWMSGSASVFILKPRVGRQVCASLLFLECAVVVIAIEVARCVPIPAACVISIPSGILAVPLRNAHSVAISLRPYTSPVPASKVAARAEPLTDVSHRAAGTRHLDVT